ncbi:MAG: nicotinamide-nucleotide amidohydrolase family protein [Neisseriaceae bacterium]|nr:nicotinamide-nucleotide amidohydrolase family protein [Neisseriaceae bacterium]
MNTLQQILQHLTIQKQTVTCAESCTGGLLAGELTRLSGSSAIFSYGFVTYSNLAKQELLGVSETTLQQFGAVSWETVKEMANGALQKANADYALAISGIAGPTGGTPNKPVGTVCFGLALKNKTITQIKHFSGSRDEIRQQAVEYALQFLFENLYKTIS